MSASQRDYRVEHARAIIFPTFVATKFRSLRSWAEQWIVNLSLRPGDRVGLIGEPGDNIATLRPEIVVNEQSIVDNTVQREGRKTEILLQPYRVLRVCLRQPVCAHLGF